MKLYAHGRAALRAGLVAAFALALSGCLSLGVEVPESLLTLSPETSAPVGASAQAGGEEGGEAIAVLTPEVPAKLDVLRVPVNVSETKIAYLEDAIWIEKPARLFRRVLGETLRARGGENAPLVLDSEDAPVRAKTVLRGTLMELSFEAATGSVVVRYDAIRSDAQGNAITRRFEARESGVSPDAASIGPALNRAANAVAVEVADWVLS
ncbi:MAG: ABC-type transport auxiliary lipoprotein family protein [Erythrobacter sp.]|uniref:ABC-type transport auxiliary lipoprotein family protein n=1 Tax=Erythrobacter sp. TaxID=1042 RepID=UPI0026306AAA|nr:ABC-type transport auxiliary lipoprotein family protein [Erythrobacter sp.]MDJ0979824.1 ABC-type transport auxiliary lipoprotein family protein [Erythrobacter sp.]